MKMKTIILLIILVNQSSSHSFESAQKHSFCFKDRTYILSQNKNNLLPPTSKYYLKFSGFMQTRYSIRENYKNSFELRRIRFIMKSDLNKKISIKLQSELAGTKPKLLDAEMTYAINNLFQISVGQFKIPFSMENMTSSSRLMIQNWSQNVDALVARSQDITGNQSGRDIGLKMSGEFKSNQKYSSIEYAVGIFNGSGINVSDINKYKDIIGRIVCFPVADLSIGGSFYKGKYTLINYSKQLLTRDRIGVEFKYNDKTFTVLSEYIMGKDSEVQKAGLYFLTAVTVFPSILQFVLKYDVFDPDLNVSNNKNSIYTIGFNFYFDKITQLQIQYDITKEESVNIKNNTLYAQLQIEF